MSSAYNVPLTNGFSIPQLMEQAQNIYDRQGHTFRLNLEFGLILRNTETGEYRYFRAYANASLFQRPVYISRRRDLNRLRLRLERFNVTDFILRQRPDTKWKPHLITNVRFVLNHLNYTLGYIRDQLPEFITACRSIVALNKSRKGIVYKDHLCAFRCLATHRGHQQMDLEAQTKHLYGEWIQFSPEKQIEVEPDAKKFKGLPLHQMVYFEHCFKTNVNVYHLRDDGVALTVYTSRCQYDDMMHVNQFDHHLSYISNLTAYTHKYQCGTCDRHFCRIRNIN